MAKQIPDYPALAGADSANSDILLIHQAGSGQTKSITLQELINGIVANMAVGKIPVTKLSSPYKFRARRTSSFATSAAGWKKVTFDTEDYDTGSNYDNSTNYRFTAPINGFYSFFGRLSVNGSNQNLIALYKNGVEYQRGGHQYANSVNAPVFNDVVQAVAGDYFEMFVYTDIANNIETASGSQAMFGGYLVAPL